jgi:hypothetical protein
MKRFSIGFFAIIIAIAGAAFTQPKKASTNVLNNKYRYTLSSNTGDMNPINYVYTTDLSGCEGSDVVCIIDAPGPATTGAHPSFPNGTDPYDNTEGVSVFSEKP